MMDNDIPSEAPSYFIYAPDPLCFLDREGNYRLLNPAWSQLTGYSEMELLHHPLGEHLHPEDRDSVWKGFEEVRDGAPASSVNARYITQDQTILFFTYRFLALGRPGTIFVVVQDLTLLKNAERELSESRERYKFLADCATEGIVLSENGVILEANVAMTRMSGFFPEEIIGQNVMTFVPAQDHEKVRAGILKDTDGFYEILGVRRNGTTFPMEIAGRFMTYQGRRVRVTLLRDISDKKKLVDLARREADLHLRDQANLFQALTENILEVVVVVNPDATIRYTGAGNPKLLGYGLKENTGRSSFDLVHPDDLEGLKQAFQELSKLPGASRTTEARVRHKDGSWRPMEITGHNLFNEPAVHGMVMNLRDVSKRRKAEERLLESERFHRAILENALDVVIVHDAQGAVQYLSPSAEWVLGYKPEKNIGRSIFDEIHPDDAGLIMETMKRMISGETSKMFLEIKARHKNGRWLDVELVTQNLLDDPAVNGFVVNLRDITDRKRAEERMLHVERLAAIGQVTGAIAHEMRNPLAVISALSREKVDTGDADGARLMAQTAKLTRLMDDILEFSRRPILKQDDLLVEVLLKAALESAGAQAGDGAAETSVRWEGNWSGLKVRGDKDRLEQVFHNLLLNAFQALGGKGTITISCRREGADVCLSIEDDGPGLGEKDLGRMFEPFYTTKKLGTGLGLAISRKIVEDHGGGLKAFQGDPRGMVFTAKLPLAPGS